MSVSPSDIVRSLYVQSQGRSIGGLASSFGVSERTIQRNIAHANDALEGIARIRRTHRGRYILDVADDTAFMRYLDGHSSRGARPQSPDERVYYLLNNLCLRNDWVVLDTLANDLFVSRRTVSNDLREVEKRLARFDLALESKPYRGIRVVGTELNKRLCLASIPLVTDEVWRAVAAMLDAVYEAYRFDFRSDLELRLNLARHVAPLLVRLSYGLRVDNPLTDDIRSRFPLAWSMALDASHALQQVSGADIDMDETGYIALAFALAIERRASNPVKRNILIACASGTGSARLLEYRFKRQFGRYLGSVRTCDASAVAGIDFSEIDCVFTTVPLSIEPPVPTYLMSAFLDTDDIGGILEVLHAPTASILMRYFSPRLFFPHMAGTSKDEVLANLLDAVEAERSVGESFRESVLEREHVAPTAFGNLVALPHPIRACGDDPFVAVALLDEPVIWGARDVQAVFLISFSDSLADPDAFNAGMAALLTDEGAIRALLANRSFETLQTILLGGSDAAQAPRPEDGTLSAAASRRETEGIRPERR